MKVLLRCSKENVFDDPFVDAFRKVEKLLRCITHLEHYHLHTKKNICFSLTFLY